MGVVGNTTRAGAVGAAEAPVPVSGVVGGEVPVARSPTPCLSPQLAIEALEQEKQSLRAQIAQVLEDRQQLMHLKMSLSLEVATYR